MNQMLLFFGAFATTVYVGKCKFHHTLYNCSVLKLLLWYTINETVSNR